MFKKNRSIPAEVHQAAQSAWSKWSDKIAAIPPIELDPKTSDAKGRYVDPDAGKSPEQKMIEKIRRRMAEYPDWYETDPEKVAATVGAHLERIGAILSRDLPTAKGPIEVWNVPLSVFNWLIEGARGEHFHHGALSAWSSAEKFNAANNANLDSVQREKLRETFMHDAPLVLNAVLGEMLKADLWISFAEKFEGSELKYLVMQVQRPVL